MCAYTQYVVICLDTGRILMTADYQGVIDSANMRYAQRMQMWMEYARGIPCAVYRQVA